VTTAKRTTQAGKEGNRLAGSGTFRLKSLEIVKFRSVVPGTRLIFSPGMNVVLGENASGKTTLLNLISMVLRSDFSEIEQEDFELAYEIEVPGGIFGASVRNERVAASGNVHGEDIATQRQTQYQTEYTFSLTVDDFRGLIVGNRAEATIKIGEGAQKAIPPVDLSGYSLHNQFGALFLAVPKVAPRAVFFGFSNFRFDESLDAFQAMIGSKLAGASCTPPATKLSFRLWNSPESNGQRSIKHISGEYFPMQIMLQLSHAMNKRSEDVNAANLPFLKEAVRLLSFKNAWWIPEIRAVAKRAAC
jgi:energy-coupling factor transporter ATP-binding protein EcfA2